MSGEDLADSSLFSSKRPSPCHGASSCWSVGSKPLRATMGQMAEHTSDIVGSSCQTICGNRFQSLPRTKSGDHLQRDSATSFVMSPSTPPQCSHETSESSRWAVSESLSWYVSVSRVMCVGLLAMFMNE